MANIFKELEELLLFYRKEDFKKLLDENYEEIGVSGKVYNKAMEMDYVNSHQALSEKKLTISDFSSKEIGKNLILHSDMSSQYTSNTFNKALKQLEIKHSYSRNVVLMTTQLLNFFMRS